MSSKVIIKLKPYLNEFITGMLNENSISSSSRPFIGRLIKILVDHYPKKVKGFGTYLVYDSANKTSKILNTSCDELEKINTRRIREVMNKFRPLESAKLLKYKTYLFNDEPLDGYIIVDIHSFDNGIDIRGNIYISDEKQHDFECLLDDYFRSLFFQYMDDKMRYSEIMNGKAEYKKCMFDFCADYNITLKNINYETLKKAYYRHRNSKEKVKIFSSVLSLTCPLLFLL